MATISADPRFRLARSLLLTSKSGENDSNKKVRDEEDEDEGIEAAIDIFAALLEESRTTHGENSLNAALCQFEYGNALFRAAVRRTPLDKNDGDDNNVKRSPLDGDDTSDSKPAAKLEVESKREVIAAAAAKQVATNDHDRVSISTPTKRLKIETADPLAEGNTVCSKDDGLTTETDDNDEDDVALAFEMMDASWSILLSHATNESPNSNRQRILDDTSRENQRWAEEQIPRVLRCIGDLYFFREEFADAVDIYLRAMQYREEAWNRLKQFYSRNGARQDNESLTLEELQCHRLLVETYALTAEALLLCPNDEDVICHHSDEDENEEKSESSKGTVLVKAKDRVAYAQSYYDMARVGLEEVICQYGKMAASNIDLGNEKEDIGYLVMSVVGVGNSLSEQQ
jgi:hypothetical protein